MDGYAVRYADVADCSPDSPKVLEIIEEIPAGYPPKKTLAPGQTARIFTGACLPTGADTIVIQEETQRQGNQVKIFAAPEPKAFVRHQGVFYQAGAALLEAGIPLGAAEIAVLAAAQCPQVPVFRRLRVAIFSTGDELVTPDQALQLGQLVDSNLYALTALVQGMGMEVLPLGIVADHPEVLQDTIARTLLNADVILSTGGVSVGDYDYVERVLTSLGAELHIRSVAIKPGKPLTVATFAECVYFGLPGNPVSALVTCWRFVQPALRKLSGLSEGYWKPVFIQARSRQDLHGGGKRETYLWGQLRIVKGGYEFELATGSHNSANLVNLAGTTGLAVVPIGQSLIAQGEAVQVLQVS
ncbi:MAG: molybdopterin molybdotransferase MoeA [Oscillatoriales cyanobacterium RM1_1_9]|nr:molybdopterin molybdotransferase MoeA [Oscillatoriales cyanobacterium RM1_1_9]